MALPTGGAGLVDVCVDVCLDVASMLPGWCLDVAVCLHVAVCISSVPYTFTLEQQGGDTGGKRDGDADVEQAGVEQAARREDGRDAGGGCRDPSLALHANRRLSSSPCTRLLICAVLRCVCVCMRVTCKGKSRARARHVRGQDTHHAIMTWSRHETRCRPHVMKHDLPLLHLPAAGQKRARDDAQRPAPVPSEEATSHKGAHAQGQRTEQESTAQKDEKDLQTAPKQGVPEFADFQKGGLYVAPTQTPSP